MSITRPLPVKAASVSATIASPIRRNTTFAGIAVTLLFGMFSIASAANRSHPTNRPISDPVLEAQTNATDALNQSGSNHLSTDTETIDALEKLRTTDPNNAVYSYLIAAYHARRGEWNPALAEMNVGNEAPNFSLATSASDSGDYPALPVIQALIAECTSEAVKRGEDETGEAMLMACGTLATRIAREATPCDISVLQNAGAAFQTVEQARLRAWEQQGRSSDAEMTRQRLTGRLQWVHEVSSRVQRVDQSDATLRAGVAEQLRSHLPK